MSAPNENISKTLTGIENIRDFIKDAAKKMPEKKLTGFIDHVHYMYGVLDDVKKILAYFDDASLNREIDLAKMKKRLNYLEEMDKMCKNRACS